MASSLNLWSPQEGSILSAYLQLNPWSKKQGCNPTWHSFPHSFLGLPPILRYSGVLIPSDYPLQSETRGTSKNLPCLLKPLKNFIFLQQKKSFINSNLILFLNQVWCILPPRILLMSLNFEVDYSLSLKPILDFFIFYLITWSLEERALVFIQPSKKFILIRKA